MRTADFIRSVESFDAFGAPTRLEEFHWSSPRRSGTTVKAFNEYWTSGQRQAHSLHEISYRACFKPQLPQFFISRLTKPGDAVYDPFMGRGTTPLEAHLLGRKPLGNDINPLSLALLEPRLAPPTLEEISNRLDLIDLTVAQEQFRDLEVFFHPDTLKQVIALKEYLLRRSSAGELDPVDRWIRMVAINRLTGHSTGFFSVYSLPPNQAVSIQSQRKINLARNQVPEPKSIAPRILRKSASLLKDWRGLRAEHKDFDLQSILTNQHANHAIGIPSNAVQLVVTSPPFLDVVNYQTDNWMRCWFLGVDSAAVDIAQLRDTTAWIALMTSVLRDLKRVLKPGGHIAFEVGEVRGGSLTLEDLVLPAGVNAGLEPVLILVNVQEFTKTANAWGVKNRNKGTNTNRVVVFKKQITGVTGLR